MMKKQKRTSRPSAPLLLPPPPPPPLQPLVLLPPGLLRLSSSTLSFVELFPFSTKSPPSRSTSLSLSLFVSLANFSFFPYSLTLLAAYKHLHTQSRRENNREMTTEKNYDDFEPAAEPTSIVTSLYLAHPRRRRVDHLDRSPTSRKLSRTSFKIQFSSCIEGFLPTLSRPHTHKHTSLSTTFSSC